MKKVYYLKTCDTCRRILSEIDTDNFILQEIKSTPITASQLDELHENTQSYEALFNKRAQKYKLQNLKNKGLTENDYRELILAEYTFLKRPIFVIDNQIFVGNSKRVVENLKENSRGSKLQ